MPFRPVRFALVALALSCSPALAQSPPTPEPSASHLEAARELIRATGSLTSLEDVAPALVTELKKMTVTRPELGKDLDEVLKILAPEMDLQRQQAVTVAAKVYAKWMTEPELREATVFFKTPVGAKFAKVQPDLSDDVIEEVSKWTQQMSEYVMVRARVEMGKRGHQLN